jgi:hypothetical protein
VYKSIIVTLLLFSSYVNANFQDDLKGEWDSYDTDSISNYYTYLRINDDLTGVFATTKSGVKQILVFNENQVKINKGYIEVILRNEPRRQAKLVASAWSNKQGALLIGILYFYIKDVDGNLKLFNSINLRMLPANGVELLPDIIGLHNKIESATKNIPISKEKPDQG